jgi:hypothetical protein
MARTIGKAFKISKKDVKSYGYASPNRGGRFTRNGGVTAIAAVNGRGSHARNRAKSARVAMNGLSREERLARARKITGATGRGKTKMRTNATSAQIAAARRNIRKAIASRRTGDSGHRPNTWPGETARHRHAALRGWRSPSPYPSTLGTAARRRGGAKKKKQKANSRRKKNMRTHRRNFSAKQRSAALRNLRKARAARSHAANPRRRSKHRRNGLVSNAKRKTKRTIRKNAKRSTKRTHRRNFSAKQRAAALRNLRKARAAQHRPNAKRSTRKHRRNTKRRHKLSPNARRTKRPIRKNAKRRTHRRNFTAKQRAAALRNLRKARAAQHRPNAKRKTRKHRRNAKRRTHRRNGQMANARRSTRKHRRNTKRRTHRRNFTAKQRAAALRNLRKARAAQHRPNAKRKTRKHRRNAKRRTHRRNGQMANSRRTKRSHRRNTRSLRMNGKAFRRNEFLATAKAVLKIGALTTAGFIAHKAVTKVFTDQVLDRLFGTGAPALPAAPAAAPAAPAISGLEAFRPYKSVIGGAVMAALGVYAVNRYVKDAQTKMFVTAGIATSLVHSVAVMALTKVAPQYAGYLAGDDATSVRIASLYGLGAGASIMPEYHQIGEYFAQNGLGEYFAQNGLGEYFAQNGLGEYFAQNGLGAYTGNPDLMQAAAGYGTVDNPNSNIVDPGGDLDRQLSIAEAAAGVGAVQPFEAAAGFGAFQEAAAGFGRVQPFEAAAGMGSVSVVPPTADTWIPGASNGQLWAGTMAVSHGQSHNEMNSAGILETSGNQGVFG